MKIITIGDLHGSTAWEKVVPEDWDRIVFIGDYVDSFYHSDDEILKNLLEVIELKKTHPEKIILLWGNHDLAYLFRGKSPHACSGFRYPMLNALADLFDKNRTLFRTAWQVENYLWTHAGIVQQWFKSFIEEQVRTDDQNLAVTLNRLFDAYYLPLFNVSSARGGWQKDSGPFWADRSETLRDPLLNYHQVVGHTKTGNGILRYFSEDSEISVTYTDCLESEDEFFELQIVK